LLLFLLPFRRLGWNCCFDERKSALSGILASSPLPGGFNYRRSIDRCPYARKRRFPLSERYRGSARTNRCDNRDVSSEGPDRRGPLINRARSRRGGRGIKSSHRRRRCCVYYQKEIFRTETRYGRVINHAARKRASDRSSRTRRLFLAWPCREAETSCLLLLAVVIVSPVTLMEYGLRTGGGERDGERVGSPTRSCQSSFLPATLSRDPRHIVIPRSIRLFAHCRRCDDQEVA